MESDYFQDDDLLLLSGIQHMAFCERQWALIHIEQAWAENVRTVEGHHLHERVDDPNQDEMRGDRLIIRAMPIISRNLGLQGVADVVEFRRVSEKTEASCSLDGREGFWRAYPIEYKRGRPKPDDRDAVQLCAQCVALEEMLNIKIDEAALYYGQIRHREIVLIDGRLRELTKNTAMQMHSLMSAGVTPVPVEGKHCSLCSLVEICQPQVSLHKKPVDAYIRRMMKAMEKE